jgi:hypothetical protein
MRRLLVAVATLVAAAATALPASAAIYPVCATRLVDAAAGITASCPTQGPQPLGNRNVGVWRTVTVEVASGGVDATLACDGLPPRTVPVSGPQPVQFGQWGGYSCMLTLASVIAHTTAVATSTYSYVIILD